jgi:hypothetical protein
MTAAMLSFTRTIDEATIHRAMLAVASDLAATTAPLEVPDLAAVARQPVSLAVAFADLAGMLGLAPPAFVIAALD